MKTKYIISCFALVLSCLTGGQLLAQENIPGEIYFKLVDDYQITLDPTSPDVNIQEDIPFFQTFADVFNVYDIKRTFFFTQTEKLTRVFRVRFENPEVVDGFISELAFQPEVEYAEEIPLALTSLTPNDLGANATSGQWGLHKIDAQSAWDLADGSGITIGIVDNAFFLNHPDLVNKYVSGYDAADNDTDPSAPNNTFEHGTHVAGIAGAETDNGTGIASIGYKANLMPIKTTATGYPHQWITHGYEGIVWAADLGAHIINCSWGGSSINTTQTNAVNYAYSQGALIIAAAGNSGSNATYYPCGLSNVMSVASTNINDQKSSFSTYGTGVAVSAPGEAINSAIPSGYGLKSGTSMASPMVAGLAALVWSADPSKTRADVVSCLLSTADNIDAQNPSFVGLLGAGRINAYQAVLCATACPATRIFVSPTDDISTATPLDYEADMSIEASNIIGPGTTVDYDAGEYILLKDGFQAQAGTKFIAFIDGCGALMVANGESFEREHQLAPIQRPNQPENQVMEFESLLKAAPNPFTSNTALSYTLTAPAVVQLELYDNTGRLVRVIQNNVLQAADTYQIDLAGDALAPGVYYCRMVAGDQVHQIKLVRAGL